MCTSPEVLSTSSDAFRCVTTTLPLLSAPMAVAREKTSAIFAGPVGSSASSGSNLLAYTAPVPLTVCAKAATNPPSAVVSTEIDSMCFCANAGKRRAKLDLRTDGVQARIVALHEAAEINRIAQLDRPAIHGFEADHKRTIGIERDFRLDVADTEMRRLEMEISHQRCRADLAIANA